MAEETLTILRVDTGQAVTSIKDLRANISQLKDALSGLEIGTEEFQSTLQQLNINQAALRAAMNGTKASMEDLTKAATGTGQSYNALVNSMATLRKELRNIDTSTEEGQKRFNELSGQILSVNTRLKEMDAATGKYQRNVGNYAEEGQKRFNELSGQILSVNTRLKEMDAATGKYQRNVGNYAGAVRGLNLAMAQVARELPSLKMGADMFFLAISNNLPILVDNIQLVREQNAKMLAETGKAPKLFGQVVKSLFSWNSLMSVGITLLTLFGGKIIDWVSGLFKAKEETDAAAKAQEELNKAMADIAQAEVKATASAKTYYSIATDVTRSMEDRLGAAQKLIKEYPQYLSDFSEEEIIAGKAADAYGRLSLSIQEAARAKAAMQKITENYSKILDLQIQLDEKQAELESATAARDVYAVYKNRADSSTTNPLAAQGAVNLASQYAAQYDEYSREVNRLTEETESLTNQIDELNAVNTALQSKISLTSEYFEGQAAAAKKAADELERLKAAADKAAQLKFDISTDDPQVDEEDPFAGMEDRQESLQKALDFQLERLEAEREQELRWNKIRTEDERARLENEYLINEEYNEKKLRLLEDFAERSPDAETTVNAQIEAADLAVQIEQDKWAHIKAMRDKDEEEEREHWKNVGKIAQAGLGAISGVLDGLADAMEANGDESAAAQERIKNMRIAAATIDTIGGAIGAFMQASQSIPPPWGQIVGAAQAAAVVATGIAQIAKIRQTDVSGDSAGSGSVSAPAAVQAPTISTEYQQVRNITGASEEERLNRMAGDQRVYVLESDIEAARNGRRVRVRESTF